MPVIWSPIFLPPPPLASLLPPPSCAGGIRHAITVPNAGGRERLFLVDPSPAATRRNRRSPGRASHVGGRGCSARLTCVGRLQAGESSPLGPVCSVTYAARLPASWAPGLYIHHASSRVMPRVHPTCILSCARKACTMPSCVSVSTSGVSPAHFVCTGGVLGLASSALVCWFVHSVRAECPFRS